LSAIVVCISDLPSLRNRDLEFGFEVAVEAGIVREIEHFLSSLSLQNRSTAAIVGVDETAISRKKYVRHTSASRRISSQNS